MSNDQAALALVLDVGTTGIKGFVFNQDQQIVSKAYRPITTQRPQPGQAEQDPLLIIELSKTVLQEAAAGVDAQQIVGLAITTQRESCVAWHAETLQPAGPVLLWQDERTAEQCQLFDQDQQRLVKELTGLSIIAYFSATKMAWLLQHQPLAQAWQAAGQLRLGTLDSWLLANLTQEKPFVSDLTNAARTLLLNINTGEWDEQLCQLFGVPRDVLPAVQPSCGHLGSLKAEILGSAVPILAMVGDQQSSLFAATAAGFTTKITYGTGTFLLQALGTERQQVDGFFTTLMPTKLGQPLEYALEVKVGTYGPRIDAVLGHDQAQLETIMAEMATAVAAQAQLLPTLPAVIVVDGGMTQNQFLLAKQAELLNRQLHPQQPFDGTAAGAAALVWAAQTNK